MILWLVKPGPNSSEATQNLFKLLLPGSMAVVIERKGNHFVYYEGGKYQQMTIEEKAKIAAGRAIDNYPTVARFMLHEGEAEKLKKVGWVNTETWHVKRDNEHGST